MGVRQVPHALALVHLHLERIDGVNVARHTARVKRGEGGWFSNQKDGA